MIRRRFGATPRSMCAAVAQRGAAFEPRLRLFVESAPDRRQRPGSRSCSQGHSLARRQKQACRGPARAPGRQRIGLSHSFEDATATLLRGASSAGSLARGWIGARVPPRAPRSPDLDQRASVQPASLQRGGRGPEPASSMRVLHAPRPPPRAPDPLRAPGCSRLGCGRVGRAPQSRARPGGWVGERSADLAAFAPPPSPAPVGRSIRRLDGRTLGFLGGRPSDGRTVGRWARPTVGRPGGQSAGQSDTAREVVATDTPCSRLVEFGSGLASMRKFDGITPNCIGTVPFLSNFGPKLADIVCRNCVRIGVSTLLRPTLRQI